MGGGLPMGEGQRPPLHSHSGSGTGVNGDALTASVRGLGCRSRTLALVHWDTGTRTLTGRWL